MFLSFLKNKVIDESLEEQEKDLLKEAPGFCSLALAGKNCDSLADNKKRFGEFAGNPIPVNGIIGELKYINRLRCSCGFGLLYHRIGSISVSTINGNVDHYETVCLNGKHWKDLYFHIYHPRRSHWCPSGYKFVKFDPLFSRLPFGYGTHDYDNNFPFGLGNFVRKEIGEVLGEAIGKKIEEVLKDKARFDRPQEPILRNRILSWASFLIGLGFFITVILVGIKISGPSRCNDGWRSNSIGYQGACSYHGGVQNNHLMEIVFIPALLVGFTAWCCALAITSRWHRNAKPKLKQITSSVWKY